MAHLMSPQPADPQLPTLFNVDGVVGAVPAQNLREDVLLVQFLLKVIGDTPRPRRSRPCRRRASRSP